VIIRIFFRSKSCLLLSGLVFVSGLSIADETSPSGDKLRESLIERFALQKSALEIHPKLGGDLNWVVSAKDPLSEAARRGFRIIDNRIQIHAAVSADSLEEVMSWLEEKEALYIISAQDIVQAYLRYEHIWELADRSDVLWVRKPRYFECIGPETQVSLDSSESSAQGVYQTEGLNAMGANRWHDEGYMGQGILVAIIDLGFSGYQDLLGAELPPPERVTYIEFGGPPDDPSIRHGTACAEIVSDLAPGLDHLYLVVVKTDVDIENAITWLVGQGVKIASVSLGSTVGPGDGSEMPEIDAWVAGGRLWINSAGNSRRHHWQGSWVDSNANGWLDFSGGSSEVTWFSLDGYSRTYFTSTYFLTELSSQLMWNQWTSPDTDLDLCLVIDRNDGAGVSILECSHNPQTGLPSQVPVESISWTLSETGYYGLAVRHSSGSTYVDVELWASHHGPSLTITRPEGSISIPADKSSVLAVAALDAGVPYVLEGYSSAGPANGPGGNLSGGITKPDISGYANVSTVSYGPRDGVQPFNGTSAACPHVAGAAALVWSASPHWSASSVRNYLESNTVDMGIYGKDNDYGYGRLVLGNPPAASCTYSVSPLSASFGKKGGSGAVTVSTLDGCSWGATSNSTWLRITSTSDGTGSGTVGYSVDSNPNPGSRTGLLTVAGQRVTITQSGTGGTDNYRHLVAGVAHATGAVGTAWRTDLLKCA